MTSLYDVFCAIRDDEGDHVGTMTSCLDPTVAKLSPSLEKKVLWSVATAASIAYFINSGDASSLTNTFVDGSADAVTDLVAAVTTTSDGMATSGILDAVVAAAVGVIGQLATDAAGVGAESEEAVEAAVTTVMEEGAMVNVGNLIGDVLVILSRFLRFPL
jgi:hypothetical protein